MDNPIRTFTFSPKQLGKWMKQNQATYTGDVVDGVLLDNFVLNCKNGTAAVYERHITPWTSKYYVEFQRGEANELWENWQKFTDSCGYVED